MDGGITVEVRSLNSVLVSVNDSMASIGGGAMYNEDVYPEVVKHGLIVLGGQIPGIGVGGFSTGGKLHCILYLNLTMLGLSNRWLGTCP